MYRFTLGDLSVECETPEELRAAAGIANGSVKIKPVKPAGKTKAAKAAAHRAKESDVPLIDGVIDWGTARKVAKDLGRADVGKVRSELVAKRTAHNNT